MEHVNVSMKALAEIIDRSYPCLTAERQQKVKAIITMREQDVLYCSGDQLPSELHAEASLLPCRASTNVTEIWTPARG